MLTYDEAIALHNRLPDPAHVGLSYDEGALFYLRFTLYRRAQVVGNATFTRHASLEVIERTVDALCGTQLASSPLPPWAQGAVMGS